MRLWRVGVPLYLGILFLSQVRTACVYLRFVLGSCAPLSKATKRQTPQCICLIQ